MKKITSVILAAILCIGCAYALMSCGGTPETTTAAETKTPTTTAGEQTTEAATTEAATTEAATTAAGTSSEVIWYEDEIMLFERREGDNHDPVAADNGVELACKFSIPSGAHLTGLLLESCPTWTSVDYSGFVVELYKWDNDYENTVIGDALYREEFEEWVDNAPCELDFTDVAADGFAYTTYMWVFRGTTDKIGIWAMDPVDECEYFTNGVDCGYGYQAVAYIIAPGG